MQQLKSNNNYGDVELGSRVFHKIVVRNTGIAELDVNLTALVGDDANEFSIVKGGAPFKVAPAESHELVVSFEPHSLGTKKANLLIESNDPETESFKIPLTGKGIPVPMPKILVNPPFHTYGDVKIGSRSYQTIVLSNEGTEKLWVKSISLMGSDSGDFFIAKGEEPLNLGPDDNYSLVVCFEPRSLGVKNAVLRIESNDPEESIFDIQLAGRGISIPMPRLAIAPLSHDFGEVQMESSPTKAFTIKNNGNAELQVQSVALKGENANEFSVMNSQAPFVVGKHSACDLAISLTPDTLGMKSATLEIESNDPANSSFTLPLTGIAIPVPVPNILINPLSHDYGNIQLGQSASHTFTVSNEGNSELKISTLSLSGADAEMFSMEGMEVPIVIAPQQSLDLTVSFNPTSLGVKNVNLKIESNDSLTGTLIAPLTGKGIPVPVPKILVSPLSHDYSSIQLGQSVSQTVTVSNEGNSELRINSLSLNGAEAEMFSIEDLETPFSIAPQQSRDLRITFSPASLGAKNVTLTIESNDPDSGTLPIPLTGKGIPVPVPKIQVSPLSFDYGNIQVDNDALQQMENDAHAGADQAEAETLAPHISVDPAYQDFGEVPIGKTASRSVVVSNDGSAPLIVKNLSLIPRNTNDFSIENGDREFTVEPGQNHDIVIDFAPREEGTKDVSLQIESNDPENGISITLLSGKGVQVSDQITEDYFSSVFEEVGEEKSQKIHLEEKGQTKGRPNSPVSALRRDDLEFPDEAETDSDLEIDLPPQMEEIQDVVPDAENEPDALEHDGFQNTEDIKHDGFKGNNDTSHDDLQDTEATDQERFKETEDAGNEGVSDNNNGKTGVTQQNSSAETDAIATRKEVSHSASAAIEDQFHDSLKFFEKLNARKCLVLDIDNDKINYLIVRKFKDAVQVDKFGTQKIDTSEVDRLKCLQIALSNIRSRFYKPGMKVLTSFISPDVNIRIINLPKTNKKADFEKAIFYKLQSEIPNFSDESLWKYQIINEFEHEDIIKLQLLITTIPAKVIRNYMEVLKLAGLQPDQLIPRHYAIFSAYKKMVSDPGNDLAVVISEDFTELSYFAAGKLKYFRKVATGYANVQKTMSQSNGSTGHKDKLKKLIESNTIDESADLGAKIRAKLLEKLNESHSQENPVIRMLLAEITRSIEFLQDSGSEEKVDRILLSGGGIQIAEVISYLKKQLDSPVILLAPQFSKKAGDPLKFSQYFNALGTALHTEGDKNFLPSPYRKSQIIKNINILLITLIVLMASGAAYHFTLSQKAFERDQEILTKLQQQYQKLNPVESEYNQIILEIGKTRQERQELLNYIDPTPELLEVLRLFSNETLPGIIINSLQFGYFQPGKVSQKKGKESPPQFDYQITLMGQIKNEYMMGDVILINFINHLTELGYFKNISLVHKTKQPERKLFEFELQLYL